MGSWHVHLSWCKPLPVTSCYQITWNLTRNNLQDTLTRFTWVRVRIFRTVPYIPRIHVHVVSQGRSEHAISLCWGFTGFLGKLTTSVRDFVDAPFRDVHIPKKTNANAQQKTTYTHYDHRKRSTILHVADLMRTYFLAMTNYWLMSIHQHTGDVKKRHTKIDLTFPWVCIDLTYIKHKQTKWRMRVRAVHGYIDNKCV